MPTVICLITLPTARGAMPACPICGAAALEFIDQLRAVCGKCAALACHYTPEDGIATQPLVCGACPWAGVVGDCEPSADGELTCPGCGEIIRVWMGAPK